MRTLVTKPLLGLIIFTLAACQGPADSLPAGDPGHNIAIQGQNDSLPASENNIGVLVGNPTVKPKKLIDFVPTVDISEIHLALKEAFAENSLDADTLDEADEEDSELSEYQKRMAKDALVEKERAHFVIDQVYAVLKGAQEFIESNKPEQFPVEFTNTVSWNNLSEDMPAQLSFDSQQKKVTLASSNASSDLQFIYTANLDDDFKFISGDFELTDSRRDTAFIVLHRFAKVQFTKSEVQVDIDRLRTTFSISIMPSFGGSGDTIVKKKKPESVHYSFGCDDNNNCQFFSKTVDSTPPERSMSKNPLLALWTKGKKSRCFFRLAQEREESTSRSAPFPVVASSLPSIGTALNAPLWISYPGFYNQDPARSYSYNDAEVKPEERCSMGELSKEDFDRGTDSMVLRVED